MDAIKWDNTSVTHIYVVNLKNGQVQTFTTERRFFLHHINSFEINDNDNNKSNISLVVDFVIYDNISAINGLLIENLLKPEAKGTPTNPGKVKRYTIHLNNKTVTAKAMPGKELDFPVMNENVRYQKYCYLYGVYSPTLRNMTLIKKNVSNQENDLIWHVPNHYPTELWFVQNPDGTSEDDGVLLDVILDGPRGKSYLAILDAKNMILVTSAYLPNFIPLSFHGRLFD